MPSSHDDDNRDMEVPYTIVNLQRPETLHQAANYTAADTTHLNATSARPTRPVGALHKLQVKLKMEVAGKMLTGRGSEEVATSKGLGKDAIDQGAGVPASSPVKSGVVTPTDNIANVTEASLSTLLERECDAQRHMNSTSTGHQHSTNAHSMPQVPDEPSMLGSPLSILLKGEQLSSSHADHGTTTQRISKQTGYAVTCLSCPHCVQNGQSNLPNTLIHPVNTDDFQ
ncbi:hypothetical protein BS17DRAFT_765003 [Gyrodon lividus]|nr:hypothetical protein BS17DRAFT_765003 [Gyrodon lividus]